MDALTVLVAKPKCGKSVFSFAMLGSLERGDPFVGFATEACPALYLSEEGTATIRQKAVRFGLRNTRFLTREDAYPRRRFAALIRAATAEAHRVGARLLCVDTLTFWAGLGPDAEKDAGAVQEIADVLLEATASGLAVLLLHHTRKSAGDLVDVTRGSNALAAAADFIVGLTRTSGDDQTCRGLEVLGRDQECPEPCVIRLDPTGYELVGTRGEVKTRTLCETILELLPMAPEEGPEAKRVQELVKAKRTAVLDALNDLVNDQLAEMTGAGKRGDPYRWRRPSDESCSGSRPYCDGTGTETDALEEDESAAEGDFDSVPGSPPIGGTGTESQEEDTATSPDSVPVLHIGEGTGTETSLRLIPVPWLGFSSELWVLWDDLWSRWQERAAMLEHDHGLTRAIAERLAWEAVGR